MSPKEKARELVYKMAVPTAIFKVNNQSRRNAKACVDEIIKSHPLHPFHEKIYELTVPTEILVAAENYWRQVKQEIENL
jgi:hypothetical protein